MQEGLNVNFELVPVGRCRYTKRQPQFRFESSICGYFASLVTPKSLLETFDSHSETICRSERGSADFLLTAVAKSESR